MVRQNEVKKNIKKKALDNNISAEHGKVAKPYAESNYQINAAFDAYLEAQKNLTVTFKESEQQSMQAYKKFELQYRSYEETMEKALKNRERDEQEAFIEYRTTVENAGKKYRESIAKSLISFNELVKQAWQKPKAGTMVGNKFGIRFYYSKVLSVIYKVKQWLITAMKVVARNVVKAGSNIMEVVKDRKIKRNSLRTNVGIMGISQSDES